MTKQFTDITVILDRSGSMQSIKEGTIAGLNNFIREQREVPGDGCWTLVQFDDQYEVTYAQRRQHDVPLLTAETFVPRGSTALVDAVCKTIDETGSRLAAMPESERPSKVLMVIMTDGMENASRTFNRHHLAERISHQRDKYNWAFIFLGANQDAIATAAGYGIAAGSSKTYKATNEGTMAVLRCASAGTRSWKLDGNQSAAGLLVDPNAANAPDVNVNVIVKN